MGDLYDQLREQETDELQAELNRVTDLLLKRDGEIAKLRAALDEIRTSPFTDDHARTIARAALKDQT